MNASSKTATNRLSAIGYRLILGVLVSVFAVNGQAAPYRASADGSAVLDQATGLVWARCAMGQKWNGKTCTGNATRFAFNKIIAEATNINEGRGLAGYNDWSVPTLRQLETLRKCIHGYESKKIDLQDGLMPLYTRCADQELEITLDIRVFSGTSSDIAYGTATRFNDPNSDSTGALGWGAVSFYRGSLGSYSGDDQLLFIRLVRSKQVFDTKVDLTFPIRLLEQDEIDVSREVKSQRVKEDARKAKVAEQNRLDALNAGERNRRDAPTRQARQMCEAQKQTCKAGCGPITYWNGRSYVDNPNYTSCDYRCSQISCY